MVGYVNFCKYIFIFEAAIASEAELYPNRENSRVLPILEKISEQVANGPRVVPWPVVYENGLVSLILLKLKRRQAAQFYEAILLNKL